MVSSEKIKMEEINEKIKEEIKRDLERLKEFSLIFIQILFFMAIGLVDPLIAKIDKLSNQAQAILAGKWFLWSVFAIVILSILAIMVVLLVWAIILFSLIVIKEYRFSWVNQGYSMLEEARKRFRKALVRALICLPFYFVIYVFLRCL